MVGRDRGLSSDKGRAEKKEDKKCDGDASEKIL
jgi:hypothetical protein